MEPRTDWKIGRRTRKHSRTTKFGCWNVQVSSINTDILTEELNKYDMDIVVLSETKNKGKGEELLRNCIHFWSVVCKSSREKNRGVILVRKGMKNKIINREFLNERIIIIGVVLYARQMPIVGLYSLIKR
jgi:exonuclease III